MTRTVPLLPGRPMDGRTAPANVVEEALEESFPASDRPAGTRSTLGLLRGPRWAGKSPSWPASVIYPREIAIATPSVPPRNSVGRSRTPGREGAGQTVIAESRSVEADAPGEIMPRQSAMASTAPQSVPGSPDRNARAASLPGVSLAGQLRSGTILVAASGEPDSNGAIAVADALAARYGARVRAIQVLDTSGIALPAPLPSIFPMANDLTGDVPYAADVRARRHESADVTGAPNEWSVYVVVGIPAEEILRHARQVGVPLITMGLRRHGMIDRVLGDETTLTVARYARGAVLGVVPELRGLPRKAVVGVDFGPASIRAARAALDLLARPATQASAASLRLVYVDRHPAEREDNVGNTVITPLGVGEAFERLVRQLDPPPYVGVDHTTLYGAPAQEIIAFASESEADLIAVGSVRHRRLGQWTLGNVTTDVIRDGRCSVLAVPLTLA